MGITLKDVETIKENLNDIPKRDIDLNNDELVPLDDTFEESRSKHRSRIPKNHPISNVIGNVNEWDLYAMPTKLEPKNVKEALGNES